MASINYGMLFIAGTFEERGMHHWQAELGVSEHSEDISAQDKIRHQRLLKTIYTVPLSRTLSKRLPFLNFLPFYPR